MSTHSRRSTRLVHGAVAAVWALTFACGRGPGAAEDSDLPAQRGVPRVLFTSPAHTTTGVELSAPIEIEFSEPMAADSLFASASPQSAFFYPEWSAQTRALLRPALPWLPDTSYTITLTARSAAHGPLEPHVLLFRTRPSRAPAVVDSEPAPNAVVGPQSAITLRFSRPMNRASVGGALSLEPRVDCDLSWDATHQTMTCRPVAALLEGTAYRVTLEATAKDAEGRALQAGFELVFSVRGAGASLAALGAACTAGGECASGHCASGVCCDSACDGACAACDLAGAVGTCGPRPAGMAGRGACVAYLCGGAAQTCVASCASSAACAPGYRCALSACVPDRGPIVDDFNDGALDAALWTTLQTAPAEVLERNGRLEVVKVAGSAAYAGVRSVRALNLTGQAVTVELASAGDQTLASGEAEVILRTREATGPQLLVGGNRLLAQHLLATGEYVTYASVPYSPAAMRYLRLREEAGTLFWEYSADRRSFTTLHSRPAPVPVTELWLTLYAGTYAAEARSTTIAFDRVD